MMVIRNALAKIATARRVETSRLCVFSGILDCRRIREHQLIQLAEGVCDIAAVEMNTELAFLHVDVRPTDTRVSLGLSAVGKRRTGVRQENSGTLRRRD